MLRTHELSGQRYDVRIEQSRIIVQAEIHLKTEPDGPEMLIAQPVSPLHRLLQAAMTAGQHDSTGALGLAIGNSNS